MDDLKLLRQDEPELTRQKSLTQQTAAPDIVDTNESLNIQKYDQILEPRQLVGVRGTGTAHDGLYFVKEVTHHIQREEFKKVFTLVRESLVSTEAKEPE